MPQPLTDAINALTTYANTVTGASDQTLSEAVATLASGYGGGGDIASLVDGTITEYIDPNITTLRSSAFAYCTGFKTLICHNVTNIAAGVLNDNRTENLISPLVDVAFPKVREITGYSMQNWRKMGKLDLTACTSLGYNRGLENCYWLTVLILRNSSVVTLGNINVFANTPFTGRQSRTADLYVPSALITQYEQATNWSTILSNGYVTIHAIEGSYYETHYVDGTPIE